MTPRPVEIKLSRDQAHSLVLAARATANGSTPSHALIDAIGVMDETIKQYDKAQREEAESKARWEAHMAEQRVKVAAAAAKLPKGYKVYRERMGAWERVAAVRSRAEFARLAGITAGEAARYVTVTGNGDQMEVAASAPGTMFVRDERVRDGKWKAVGPR